jgi:hypothetical protein
MPLEKVAPIITPSPAIDKITFTGAALEPREELIKFAASLEIPTIRSEIARIKRIIIIIR